MSKKQPNNKPPLDMATKYGVSYVIIRESKPRWRQIEIDNSIGKDTRPNNDFAREVIEFAEDANNLTIIEDKLEYIETIAQASTLAQNMLSELKLPV